MTKYVIQIDSFLLFTSLINPNSSAQKSININLLFLAKGEVNEVFFQMDPIVLPSCLEQPLREIYIPDLP